jgi:hypothetical protein
LAHRRHLGFALPGLPSRASIEKTMNLQITAVIDFWQVASAHKAFAPGTSQAQIASFNFTNSPI